MLTLDFPLLKFWYISNYWPSITATKLTTNTAQKMKFSIKDFFSKCNQTRRKLRIWSHLLKKSLMENFILYAVKFCISALLTNSLLTIAKLPLSKFIRYYLLPKPNSCWFMLKTCTRLKHIKTYSKNWISFKDTPFNHFLQEAPNIEKNVGNF